MTNCSGSGGAGSLESERPRNTRGRKAGTEAAEGTTEDFEGVCYVSAVPFDRIVDGPVLLQNLAMKTFHRSAAFVFAEMLVRNGTYEPRG